jgi:hypothetical protein
MKKNYIFFIITKLFFGLTNKLNKKKNTHRNRWDTNPKPNQIKTRFAMYLSETSERHTQFNCRKTQPELLFIGRKANSNGNKLVHPFPFFIYLIFHILPPFSLRFAIARECKRHN